jgi:hypothetical protein
LTHRQETLTMTTVNPIVSEKLFRFFAPEALERIQAGEPPSPKILLDIVEQYQAQTHPNTGLPATGHDPQPLPPLTVDEALRALHQVSPAEALAAAKILADQLAASLGPIVAVLRQRGTSWHDIGGLLGMTKQAAHERFAKDEP